MQQQPQKKMVVSKKLMKVGPWGGAGGSPWDDGGHTGIRSITLSYDRCVDSIAVEYDRNGVAVPGERHGGAGGNQTTQIKLSFPEEYVTTVSGHYAPVAAHGGEPAIRSLAFTTNRREYGPFGAAAEGTPFTFPVDGGAVVGFWGRSGRQLDAVGVHVAPLRPETMYEKAHKMGLMAYRSVRQRIGSQQQQQQQQVQVQHQSNLFTYKI
ncbi:jacalin-related lectin 19-like isoform X2 [Oryza brachyantha]|uniref:jacalin-related lectin 19-like isoform X2 n=1 Tax=Oryza brachyantha TaxID=4533 RepID=UPI000776569B|nr:jacalin-related lectin 19-like isoform X2 [Oryza brachyantha]